jgi:O-antigen/teichoic acid export membrane protein
MTAAETTAEQPSAAWAAAGNLRWALAGSIVPAGLALLANVVLARWLGIADFGEWVYFTQIAGYVAAVLLGVVTFTLAYHLPRGDYDGADLLNATGVCALAIGVAGAVVAAVLAPIALGPTDPATLAVGMVVVPLVAAQFWAFAALDATLAFARRAGLAVLTAGLSLGGFLILIVSADLSPFGAIAVRVAAIAISVVLGWRIVRQIVPRVGRRLALGGAVRFVLRESWPVTVGSLIGAGTAAAVLVAIGGLGGQATIGAAGIGLVLAQPITLLSVALSSVLLPHGAREPQGRRSLRRLGFAASAVALVYAAIVSWQGPQLLELIGGTVPSGAMVAVAVLLLWGAWFRQVAGVDIVMLRAGGWVMPSLGLALLGALPILPIAWLATQTVTQDSVVAIALAWAVSQAIAMLVAAALVRRRKVTRDG